MRRFAGLLFALIFAVALFAQQSATTPPAQAVAPGAATLAKTATSPTRPQPATPTSSKPPTKSSPR